MNMLIRNCLHMPQCWLGSLAPVCQLMRKIPSCLWLARLLEFPIYNFTILYVTDKLSENWMYIRLECWFSVGSATCNMREKNIYVISFIKMIFLLLKCVQIFLCLLKAVFDDNNICVLLSNRHIYSTLHQDKVLLVSVCRLWSLMESKLCESPALNKLF